MFEIRLTIELARLLEQLREELSPTSDRSSFQATSLDLLSAVAEIGAGHQAEHGALLG